ncbi:hydrogenase maturation protease [Rhodopseudomonas rhenobacensis]|uniref:Hydrogenase expression/formation protein HupD n=1 Tax=Rhodopseudomonas rhenobacensis TaxID=87461 RepID=A0A7W7Z3E1_9BRAD|nr:HyaD/HybD family hydrogenase maturation endopeptidase [Rhodopseudomonas rhenobacensis]MBB5047305.1 hydrogenase maturation protease [Rhodopseudomonas rhenobacensis]
MSAMISSDSQPLRTLVLGIGNILWADEGFGVRAVEQFHQRYVCPENVTVMDGGTQGLYLVQYVNEADRLIVFDAVDYGLAPGTLKLVRNEEVPKFTGIKKMSLHQTGFQEVLSAAELLGHVPSEMLLIGCQPQDLENWGGPLTAPVRGQIDAAVDAAVAALAAWGVEVTPRERPLAPDERLLEGAIDFDNYERCPTARALLGDRGA